MTIDNYKAIDIMKHSRRYMTIDKVPDCIGVMKFERVKEGEEKEAKEVEMDD